MTRRHDGARHADPCGIIPRLPFADLGGRTLRLKDLTGPASYDRDGTDLASRGLYLDLPPWAYHVFEMTTL